MSHDVARIEEHRPTEAFRDFLDGQLSRAFRQDRTVRRLRFAAVVVVSLALGTTGGLASAQIKEGSQRDSLLEAARADAALVSLRLKLVRMEFDEQRRALLVGAASTESVTGTEARLREMEGLQARAALNMEEIKASATAPRDELNAPLVKGRDYVTERIQLRLMSAQQQLEGVESALQQVIRRVRAGVGDDLANLEAEQRVAQARREMIVLAERLALRKEFLEKGTPVDQLTRRLERAELRQDVVIGQRAVELARERALLLEKRRAVGVASELDVMKAQVEAKERELELQQLVRRLGDTKRPGLE
ncbi:MAG: hypothetical protein V4550_14190 [Gemmatimonadota bacterium]